MPSVKTKIKLYWQALRDLSFDYANHSTIHGVSYVAENGRSWYEKVWWIVVLCVSVLTCGKLIFDAWNINPIIISFTEKPIPIWQIPFPAVTICPVTATRKDSIHLWKLVENQRRDINLFKTLTEHEKQLAVAKYYMCMESVGQIKYLSNYTNCNHCLKTVREMRIPPEKLFVKCKFRNREINCKESLIETIVEANYCYTFNEIGIYRQLSGAEHTQDIDEDWSVDDGYKPSASADAYPYRVLDAGEKYGFSFTFRTEKKYLDYACWNFGGLVMTYRMPYDTPRIVQSVGFAFETAAEFIVTPQVMLTSDEVRQYDSTMRKCVFSYERRLKYYKHYTLNNCETECETDLILIKCGCMPIYIENDQRGFDICGPALTNCVWNARMSLSEQNFFGCDCLPMCTSISYDSEVITAKLNKTVTVNPYDYLEKNVDENIEVNIYFKVNQLYAQERKELYGSISFLANCGGLLGLCLGVSVISFLEILYFCTVRLWFGKHKSDITAFESVNVENFQRSKLKRYLTISVDIVTDYLKNTTIHGIKYIAEPGLALFEKIWWTIIIVISVFCCGSLTANIFQRYDQSPVTITYASEETSISQIPFPAITMCPQMISDDMPFLYDHFNMKNLSLYDLDDRRKSISTSMVQVCDSGVFNDIDPENITNCITCASTLKSLIGDAGEMFSVCNDLLAQKSCSETLKTVVTEEGVCFVYNNVRAFRTTDELQDTSAEDWTLDGGYVNKTGQVDDQHPRAGSKEMFYVVMQKLLMIDNICKGGIRGFKFYLHLPSEVPQMRKSFYLMPYGRNTKVAVHPKMTVTVPELRDLGVAKRQCYFSDERFLRFFRHYTQNNCEIECLVNLTLNRCGCLMFHMPKIPTVKYCSISDVKCYQKIINENAEENIKEHQASSCHCLTTCTSISYEAEIAYAIYSDQYFITALAVTFRDSRFLAMKRSQLFGKTEFLANCGGLLGFFLGFSVISILELLYFITLRLICNLKVKFM